VYYQHVKRDKVGKHVFFTNVGMPERVGTIRYLSETENARYCEGTVRLHSLFYGLAKMPQAKRLGESLVALKNHEWTWDRIGNVSNEHLKRIVPHDVLVGRLQALCREMGLPSSELLPKGVKENPHYFTYFPSGGVLAQKVVRQGIFDGPYPGKEAFHDFATVVRRHLFDYGLYKVQDALPPIAT
jgi:hypothetical protein